MAMTLEWPRWQTDIVNVLRYEYCDLFPLIRNSDIDWEAWKPLYDQGCSPRLAIEQAISGSFERTQAARHSQ
jgi:hypothetical protein